MSRQRKAVVLASLFVFGWVGLAWDQDVHAQEPIDFVRGEYRLVEDWPHYPPDLEFQMGSGVAVDADGVVYVYTRDRDHWAGHPLVIEAAENGTLHEENEYRGRGGIYKFSREGEYLGQFAPNEPLIGAHSLYIDDEGFIWVVDRDGHQIKKMRPDGTVVMALGEFGRYGDNDSTTRFNGPTSIAFLPNGNFVVSDGYWNSRLVFFDKDGNYIKHVGEWGPEPENFGFVHTVALDSQGRLLATKSCGGGALHPYVTAPGQIRDERTRPIEGCQSQISIFDTDGNYQGRWPALDGSLSLNVFGDVIFASGGREDGWADLYVVNAKTDEIVNTIEDANVHIHQAAMDKNTGDIYIGSVYPEHGGGKRGREGPSNRRWTPVR